MDLAALIVLSIVAGAFMFGSGAWVGTYVGRQAGPVTFRPAPRSERRAPERLIRELDRCVELGDCVTRDADCLSSLVADPSASLPREVASAIAQLIKTTKNLAGRLRRVGEVGELGRVNSGAKTSSSGRQIAEPCESAQRTRQAAALAPQTAGETIAASSDLRDARRFPRSQFRGSAKATIYPSSSSPSAEPIQCTVLTRNLSCGGVGIAFSERLYPQQIIVMEAVGKVLVGEIRWCRQVEESFFVAGCRLVKASD